MTLTTLSPAQQRAINQVIGIGQAQEANEADIRRAFANTLPAFFDALSEDEDMLRKVFILFETVAKRGDAKKMSNHPLRPHGIDADIDRALAAKRSKGSTPAKQGSVD